MYDDKYRLVPKDGGEEVVVGQAIFDFRGDQWWFRGISATPDAGRSGKVLAAPFEYVLSERPTSGLREFYPTVFGCRIERREVAMGPIDKAAILRQPPIESLLDSGVNPDVA